MKIFYVAASIVPSKAANSVHVVKMSNALAENGCDVILSAQPFGKDADLAGIDIFRFYDVKKTFQFLNFPALDKFPAHNVIYFTLLSLLFLLKKPDFIFTRDLYAAACGCWLGKNVIYEKHNTFESKEPWVACLFQRIMRHKKLKKLVVISDALKNDMISLYNIPADKILVAHDGADVILPDTNPRLPPGIIKIGYTGHLYEGRGINIIGEAARLLPDYEFHIVGGLSGDVDSWRLKFSDIGNIVFHGYVPPADIPAFLKSFDILLAPYQEKVGVHGNKAETGKYMSPLKIFEYMSTGKPILCSDISVLQEVMKDRKNCLLCEPSNPASWVQNIHNLVNDKALSETLASNALQEFLQKYTWHARAATILQSVKVV